MDVFINNWPAVFLYLFLDMTDSSSFERARFWVKEIQSCEEVEYVLFLQKMTHGWINSIFIHPFSFHSQNCKIYLCGTKADLIEADRSTRQVDYHDVQDFADGKH